MRWAAPLIMAMACLSAAEPEWADTGLRISDGRIVVAAGGAGHDRIAARTQARQRALALVAEHRSVDIAAQTTLTTLIHNTDVDESMAESITSATSARIRVSLVTDEEALIEHDDGTVTAWVLMSMAEDDLFPQRRLQRALRVPPAQRVGALTTLAEAFESEQLYPLAELALRQAAAQPTAGASTLVVLGWFYHRQDDDLSAQRYAEAARSRRDELDEADRDRLDRLQATLTAALPQVHAAVREIDRLAEAAYQPELFHCDVIARGGGRFLLRWHLPRDERRLLLLWNDGEDLATVPFAGGSDAAAAFTGVAQSALNLPPDSRGAVIIAWAMAADDPVWDVANDLGDRTIALIDNRNEWDRLWLRSLLNRLRRSSRAGVTAPAYAHRFTLRP